jgi:hypothetical protein
MRVSGDGGNHSADQTSSSGHQKAVSSPRASALARFSISVLRQACTCGNFWRRDSDGRFAKFGDQEGVASCSAVWKRARLASPPASEVANQLSPVDQLPCCDGLVSNSKAGCSSGQLFDRLQRIRQAAAGLHGEPFIDDQRFVLPAFVEIRRGRFRVRCYRFWASAARAENWSVMLSALRNCCMASWRTASLSSSSR